MTRRPTKLPYLLGAVVGLLPLSALADTAPPFSCAAVRTSDHWRKVDASTIVIETAPHLAYKVTFVGACRKLRSSVFARVESQSAGGLICLSPGDVMIFGRGQSFPAQRFEFEERCVISSVEPTTAAE